MKKKIMESDDPDEIVVTSAIALSPGQLESIRKILPSLFDKNLTIVNRIDKKLLGGFILQTGDWYLDASLIHQLKEIKDSLIKK